MECKGMTVTNPEGGKEETVASNTNSPSASSSGVANNDFNLPSTSGNGAADINSNLNSNRSYISAISGSKGKKQRIYAIGYNPILEKQYGILLFSDEASALKFVNKNKLAKCRIFTSLPDAVDFASEPRIPKKKSGKKRKKSKLSKRLPRYYAPLEEFYLDLETICEDPRPWNPKDMRVLYSFIKNNDTENFSEFIWSFPHLLYCDGALPRAELDGSTYNLLQITVIFNAPIFCQLILDILEHPRFYEQLFPTKGDEDRSEKVMELLRLYLNSSLAENGDTPLHYASKRGFTDCCKILLAHPLCEKEKTNNEGFAPVDVTWLKLGGRVIPSFIELKDLKALFSLGLWYVTIFRSDKGLKPFVGKPCECKYFTTIDINTVNTAIEEWERETMRSYSLKAFAGPMSYIMALRFYTALTKPSTCFLFSYEQENVMSKIKNLEPNRGIERIGRTLAADLNIEWKEFFPALDVFTNLRTPEGMRLFEKYWESRWAHESHCSPLPSSLVNVEPREMALAVIRLHPPHVNALCHRANLLYCYHKKFLKVGVEDVIAEDNADAIAVPSSSSELERSHYDADHDIYMNGCSLSELDKEVYMSLMQDFSTLLYPKTAKWKARMTAELQSESLEMGNDRNLYEYDPLQPIPVPHARDH